MIRKAQQRKSSKRSSRLDSNLTTEDYADECVQTAYSIRINLKCYVRKQRNLVFRNAAFDKKKRLQMLKLWRACGRCCDALATSNEYIPVVAGCVWESRIDKQEDCALYKALVPFGVYIEVFFLTTFPKRLEESPHVLKNKFYETQNEKIRSLQKLVELEKEIDTAYKSQINKIRKSLGNKLAVEYKNEFGTLDPATLGKRGRARSHASGAWRGWIVKELNASLPKTLVNRYSVISRTLALLNYQVSSVQVRSIIMRGKT